MNIAIVDDERIWQEKIQEELKAYFTHRGLHMDLYASGRDLMKSKKEYDALMLDVEMPGENGIDVGEEYKNLFPKTEIIILTVHLEFSMEGYRSRPLRYIDKNRMHDTLPAALEALELFSRMEEEIRLHLPDSSDEFVPVGEICWIEIEGHGTRIHTSGNSFRTMNSIGEIEEQLDPLAFFRSHKSFLVNWKYAREIRDGVIMMQDGSRPFISRRKLTEGKIRFLRYSYLTGKG